MPNFYDVIRQAIADFEEHGFDSQERLDKWMREIKSSAEESMISEDKLREQLDRTIKQVFLSQIGRAGILAKHRAVKPWQLQQMRPKLEAEMNRRIMASAQLIRMNREAMIQTTLQRFSGWATSIPKDGSEAIEKREVKDNLSKALKSLPFEERRVMIDQGFKFKASLDNIVASDGGAIAATWHSNWKQKGYNYRQDHKERDKKIYVLRDNWAIKAGLMKLDGRQYTDEITMVGEEVYCQCTYEYLYALRDLPESMLTNKGKEQLSEVRTTKI